MTIVVKSDKLKYNERFAAFGRSWKDCPYSRQDVLLGRKQDKQIQEWIVKYLNGTT